MPASDATLDIRPALEALLEHGPFAVALLDANHQYVRVNDLMAEMNGLPAADHAGRPAAEVVPEMPLEGVQALRDVFATGQPVRQLPIDVPPQNGSARRSFVLDMLPVTDDTGTTTVAVVIAVETTRQQRLEDERERLLAELTAQALTDSLTGLPNRRAWNSALTTALISPAGDAQKLCVALLDIDDFKTINDDHGHDFGDQVLISTASRWHAELRPGDVLARYGGDEFAVLLPRCDVDEARTIVERLRTAAQDTTGSAGITYVRDTDTPQSVMHRVDAALYQAKRAGRNCIHVA